MFATLPNKGSISPFKQYEARTVHKFNLDSPVLNLQQSSLESIPSAKDVWNYFFNMSLRALSTTYKMF
jgi:hypothetical protein